MWRLFCRYLSLTFSSFCALGRLCFITKTCLFKYTENFTTKKWKFSDKKILYFTYFWSKHRLWVLVRTVSKAVLTSTHNLCFWAEIRKIMYTPVNPSFTIQKWGLRRSKLYRHVFVMFVIMAFPGNLHAIKPSMARTSLGPWNGFFKSLKVNHGAMSGSKWW